MATLFDLYPQVINRLEESDPPIFWSLIEEVYPQMVDAQFEASLVTGIVQTTSVVLTLKANQTYFMGLPKGMVAPLRMRAPYPIRKASLHGLDDIVFDWQTQPASSQIAAWFPLGVSGFGIYPQLTADAEVTMDFIASPVNVPRPYTGNEVVPFPQQFTDLIPEYAAAMLRVKETGIEAELAAEAFQEYMEMLKQLSLFQTRIDDLNFSATFGASVRTKSRTSA